MLISEPQSRFIKLDDLNLHYLEWGTPGKTPMVLLHGWGDTAWLYKRAARPFEEDFHIFSLDLRGHGQTTEETPGQRHMMTVLGDVAKFFEALDLKEAVLVGYSYGGTVAHRYATDHQERVKALCIIDIGIENTPTTFDPTASPERIEASRVRAWERFKQLKIPTLMIMAEHSHLLKPDIAQRMVEAIPQGRLAVIEGIDHRVFKRHAELAEALAKFLKEFEA